MAAMFENIRNAITRLPIDRLWRNLGGHMPERNGQREEPTDISISCDKMLDHQCQQSSDSPSNYC